MRSLKVYLFKIDYYTYKEFFVSLVVATKQRPTVDTQKIKSIPLWKIIKSQSKTAKEVRKGSTINWKTR